MVAVVAVVVAVHFLATEGHKNTKTALWRPSHLSMEGPLGATFTREPIALMECCLPLVLHGRHFFDEIGHGGGWKTFKS